MGKIMEAIFCVAYLIVTFILGISIIRNAYASEDMHVCLDCGNGI